MNYDDESMYVSQIRKTKNLMYLWGIAAFLKHFGKNYLLLLTN